MSPALTRRETVAGVSISHPDRVLFPVAGITKLGLARYYESIADWVLPHLVDRPLTLVHCPKGIPVGGARKGVDCVFMKHAKLWGPSAIRRERIREKTKVGEYLVADSLPALISLAQMDILEIHTWNSRCARVEQPDRIVVDLDPGERVGWKAVVDAAILVRRRPAMFTERFAKVGREDKILIDYLRNNRTNTSIAAFSTRAKPDATVSVPITWAELSRLGTPSRFTIAKVPQRLARLTADPWKAYWDTKQTLPRAAAAALENL